jgi:hypothetical protein
MVTIMKRSAHAIGARTEGCCLEYEMSSHIAKHGFISNNLV